MASDRAMEWVMWAAGYQGPKENLYGLANALCSVSSQRASGTSLFSLWQTLDTCLAHYLVSGFFLLVEWKNFQAPLFSFQVSSAWHSKFLFLTAKYLVSLHTIRALPILEDSGLSPLAVSCHWIKFSLCASCCLGCGYLVMVSSVLLRGATQVC